MNIKDIVEFVVIYIVEYLETFLETLQSPILRLKPIWKKPDTDFGNGKFIFNPRLFSFSVLSIIFGMVIQGNLPNYQVSENYFQAIITIIALWLAFSSIVYYLLFPKEKRSSFLESISLIFQILSTQYVISSFIVLIWSIIYRALSTIGFPANPSSLYVLLGESPILGYFIVQFVFLSLYIPYAIISTSRFTRTIFILLSLGTILVNLVWSSFSVFAFLVVGGPAMGFIPTPTPTLTGTPTTTLTVTSTFTPTLSPTLTPSATSTPEAHGRYYMIVLDASLNMQETFDGMTKWDAAIGAVNAVLEGRERDANFGLVVIGGSPLREGENPCGQPATLAVPFASRESVMDHIDHLKPSGGGSIYTAFNLAKEQFNPELMPENTVHTLVFITGSSDACLIRDEWMDIQRAYNFPGGIGVDIYSEIIVLEKNELKIRTIEQQIGGLSDDLNVQVPQNNNQLYQAITNVFNNVTNYELSTSATQISAVQASATYAFTPQTPTFTPSPRPTQTPANTMTVFPTFTPTSTTTKTFTPTATRTATPSKTSTPMPVCISTRAHLNSASFGGTVTINTPLNCSTGYVPETEIYTGGTYSGIPDGTVIWVLASPPNGLYYPQSPNACATPAPPPAQGGGGWNVKSFLGTAGNDPEWFDVVAVLVDQAGSDFLSNWVHNGCQTGEFNGIPASTLEQYNITEKNFIRVQTQ